VLVIDMIQFFIKMTAVFAAAWFSLVEVGRRLAGDANGWVGLKLLVAKLSTMQVNQARPPVTQPVMSVSDGTGQPILDMMPNFGMTELALMIFIMPIAVSWWANWYPGAEPGGGSYIAQRMLASKSEKDALGGTLFFNVAHYVLRPWPWIITALCSIIVYPDLASIRRPSRTPTRPHRPRLGVSRRCSSSCRSASWADDRRTPRRELLDDPHAPQLGLVVPGARLLSRFIRKDASEAHYVNAGRVSRCCSTSSPRCSVAHHELGAAGLSGAPLHRRGHRAPLHRALVLVARLGVVRDRGDGHVADHLAGRCPS
jgi:hypothetical protein